VSRKTPDSFEKRIDTALASWPLLDRGSRAWEDMAKRIEAKIIAAGASRAPIGTLLDAPLPTEPHEAHVDDDRPTPRAMRTTSTKAPAERRLSQAPMERERDRRSLKDLAKLAASPSLTPPPPATRGASVPAPPNSQTHDSGIVDLKQMGVLDNVPRSAPYPASARPPSPGFVPPASGPGLVSLPPSSARFPAPPPISSRPSAAIPPPRPLAPSFNPYEKKKGRGGVWLGLGFVAAAAAAAVLVLTPTGAKLQARFFPPHAIPTQTAAAAAPPPAETVASAAPAPSEPPAPAQSVASIDTAPPPSHDQAAAADSVPPPAVRGAPPRSAAVGPRKSVTVAGGAADATSSKPAPPPNPALVAKNIPTSSPQGGSSFDNALRQAAGPIETPSGGDKSATSSAPPPVETGNVPLKPSAGAVAAGVGVVMAPARSCLSAGDAVTYAAVTFGSSGTVSSVAISGSAAGKPAEGCIKAALGRAKVPAFAQPNYTQRFPVRPN
jgi:hypothetical protein